jgi:predicted negative regulator of RcsB-dependent stress response
MSGKAIAYTVVIALAVVIGFEHYKTKAPGKTPRFGV